ncbi:hypothetical protein [Novosphingobium sp.]|uniref:beta strand repeat-containing protein n=1 Tax=Novosphingobium sp. TaxID=1874826 RepID=UPI001DAC11A9|nr:hypothetical protein [Novosphingobium sp.]MBX9662994.1 hypothetical protein [Novosphingobium sp.]
MTGEATTGSIGLFAGGAITATTLTAGVDISALGGTTGALTKTDVAITSATAGDDIDLAALNGNLSLGTGSAEATGATTTRITFAGAPGTGATIGVAASEDAQLGGSTIRLRSAAGDITSATSLTTLGGDVLVNASNDVSLTTVTATGGSIAVRAGRDVTKATTLKSNSEDVTVGAGRNATLGTLTALDDIDLAITGNLTFTRLALTGGSDGTRFADVISGSAGAVGGVTFNPVDDLALAGANVVRVKAGSVGTPGAEANALIAGDVTSGTFTADASSGDIRLRNVTAAGNLGATATLGSVTGVADGYAATTETNIVDAVGHTVLIDVGSGAFGTINAGSVKTVTSGANVLRINNIDAGTVSLAASNTLDVGTIVATGLVDLKTTGGTAASGTALEIINPATKLAPGFGAATLTATPANATITVSAVGGVAQLGTLTAGTGADPDPSTGAAGQITVDARALTITTALARDGGIAATASAGLLQVGTGTAKQAITLTKRNLDGISAGSDTTTDVLRAANLTSNANAVVLLSDTSIDVTTKAKAATDLKLSAAKTIGIVTGEATTGSIGLLAGDAITATTLTAGVDISALGGTTGALTKTDVAITSATAGDDIDLVALNGNVSLTSGFSKSTTGTRGTSVTFGSPGAAGSVAVTVGEDAALALSTIQLRSTAGDAISSTSLSTTEGDVIATAFRDVSITKATANGGNILGSAGRDASLTTGFASGSIGLLAGRTITGGTLNAGVDIAARGGTTGAPLASDVTITSATAGDDIDLVALNGNVSLTSGSSKNSAGTRGTSVTFSSPGAVGSVAVASGEDAALALSTIRLRSATADVISTTNLSTTEGDVVATAFRDVSITKATANGGNLLGSAGRNVGVTTGSASGSIGLLAGGTITGGTLNAGVDIAARSGTTGAPLASDVTITSATAGDDIDLAALNGNVSLTSGSSKNSAGTRGTSVTFGSPGTVGSVAVASGEDAALALSTIRLRSATADVISATNLSTTEGDVVATAFRDVSITKATANGGNILGSAGRDASLTTGFASGSIGLLAGRTITGGTLNAGVDIAARGGTTGAPLASDVTITSATAGDDIDLVALNGNVSLTSGSSKNSAGTRGTSVTFSSPGAVGSVAVASGEDAALALSTIRLRSATADVISTTNLSTTEGDVVATAFRDVSITKATANGGNLLGSAGRNVGVTTGSASGSIGLLAGNTITGGNLNAGVDVTAKAGNGATITSATAGDDIDLLTDAGNINLATGQSNGVISSRGTSVSFGTPGAAGSVTVGSGETADLALSTIRLRAETGSVTSSNSLTTLKGDVVATALRDVTLAKASATGGNLFASAGGNLGVTTGDATGSIGLLAAGTVTAGTLGAGVDVAAKGGAGVAITSATAGDDIDLLADTGAVSLATGLSNGASAARGTSVTFATPGAKGSVAVASSEESQLGRSTIRLRAATGNVTSATSLTTKQGDVIANAALKVTLGDVNAAGGSVAALTGSEFKADTITASEDIAVATKGNLTVTKSLTAGDDIALSAVDTVTIGSDGASIKEPATGRDTRSAKLTLADAGKLSGVQFETESAAATKGSSITLEGSDVAIGGKIDALTGTIRLRNTGTGTVSIGDPGTGSTAAFKVDNTEFGRLAADTVLVDSGNKAVTIGTLDVAETTGKVATRLLGTGNVFEVTGVVTVKGTASRTLQIGGQDGDPGKIDTLASQILMVIDGDKRPKILGPSATIDLRGDKILFGTAAMRADTLDKSDAEVAQQVASVDSKLYTDPTAQTVGVFMTAKAMKLSYKSFALFQNTRISSSVGVEINSIENGLPNQSDLALQLFSAGDSPTSNSFAMFGVVNNFRLNTAAILSNKVIQLSDPADTNNISRVNRSNSRINGCVIGAPDKGCLTTDVAQPKFNFYDERKVALFDAGDSATIAVSPLIGRGNDGLIVDVANAPVDIDSIECRPDDSSCTANKGN